MFYLSVKKYHKKKSYDIIKSTKWKINGTQTNSKYGIATHYLTKVELKYIEGVKGKYGFDFF